MFVIVKTTTTAIPIPSALENELVVAKQDTSQGIGQRQDYFNNTV